MFFESQRVKQMLNTDFMVERCHDLIGQMNEETRGLFASS